jgi:hypothetical protein
MTCLPSGAVWGSVARHTTLPLPNLSQTVRAASIPSCCPELGQDFRDDEGRYQSEHDALKANML